MGANSRNPVLDVLKLLAQIRNAAAQGPEEVLTRIRQFKDTQEEMRMEVGNTRTADFREDLRRCARRNQPPELFERFEKSTAQKGRRRKDRSGHHGCCC